MRRYRVVSERAGLDSVHEGRGLTVETVIGTATEHVGFMDDGLWPLQDITIYSDEVVVAIVRKLGDGKGGFRVLRVPDAFPPDTDAPTPPDADARVEDEMTGIRNLYEVEDENRQRKPVAYSVTEGEFLLYHSHWRCAADEAVAEAVKGWQPHDTHHQAVWHGEALIAVIRPGQGGRPEVVRLDGGGGGFEQHHPVGDL